MRYISLPSKSSRALSNVSYTRYGLRSSGLGNRSCVAPRPLRTNASRPTPAAWPAIRSVNASPIMTERPKSRSSSFAAWSNKPGLGFRQSQSASGACGHRKMPSTRPPASSINVASRQLIASAAANDIWPRPTADWLVTNTTLYGPWLAFASASNACGKTCTSSQRRT